MERIPERKNVLLRDTWDLSSLYNDDEEWESELAGLEKGILQAHNLMGSLGKSAHHLADALEYIENILGRLAECFGYYVMLRQSENVGDGKVQWLYAHFRNVSTMLEVGISWMGPEIMGMSDKTMKSFLEDPELAEFKIYLTKLRRFKKYTLSQREETLLAKQLEFSHTFGEAFTALTNADMDFGTVNTPEGRVPLTHSTYSSLMLNNDREIRKQAYRKFHRVYDRHRNTLAQLLSGNILQNKYHAEVRGYSSARAQALYRDDVPVEVYDNLVNSVRANLPALHDYYRFRAEKLSLVDDLRHWDTHIPLVEDVKVNHTWDEAVEVITQAMAPLGAEYTQTLNTGLSGRWADRYENKGKRSGAFSAGSYMGDPYILMNFKEDTLRDVFTLIHEGGHSMHSWYSVRNNPYSHYKYTIFEAEVASTFNEQLLGYKLLKETNDKKLKAYLIGKSIDEIIGTIYRQTMFAEFERDTHAMAEAGEPLTTDTLRARYRELMEDYFGPTMHFEKVSDLECLRVPHFYHAFYVYKYATGLSAAMTLAKRVIGGGSAERDSYLNFLKSGGSRFPLESLKLAGVDMSTTEVVDTALAQFKRLVDQLKLL